MRIPKLFTCVLAALTLLVAAGCASNDSVVYYREIPGYGLVPVNAAIDPATGFVTYPQTYSAGTVRYVRGNTRFAKRKPQVVTLDTAGSYILASDAEYGTASLLTSDLPVTTVAVAPAAAPVVVQPSVPVVGENYRVVYRRGRRGRLPRMRRQVVGVPYVVPAETTAVVADSSATESTPAATTVTTVSTATPVAEPAPVAVVAPVATSTTFVAQQPIVYAGETVVAQPLMQALPAVQVPGQVFAAPQAAVVSEPLSALFAYSGIDVASTALASLCAPGNNLSECFTMNDYQLENTPVAVLYPDAEGAVPFTAAQVAFAAPAPAPVVQTPAMPVAAPVAPVIAPAPVVVAAPVPAAAVVAPPALAPAAPIETSKYQALTPPRDFAAQAALPPASPIRPETPRPEVSMPTPLGNGEIMPPVPAASEIENALDVMLSGEMLK